MTGIHPRRVDAASTGRYLIVNADDFGMSQGVNEGIIEAHEHGIVTSASLMVRWPAAGDAADYARQHPELSLGLHIDLGEWTWRDGTWEQLYDVVPTEDGRAVQDEVARQVAAFRHFVGRDPTHIDSHQHVHREEPTRSILQNMACSLGVSLRGCSSHIRYCGDFYGQTDEGRPYPEGIAVDALIRILVGLSPGVTELGCHPGLGGGLETMYRAEREQEASVLCDPAIHDAVVGLGIGLCSFATVAHTRST